MFRIGRYRIAFRHPYFWIQARVPTTIKEFLCFRIFREALPTDIDKVERFPLGTEMEYEGKKYHYYKAGGNINVRTVTTTAKGES